MTNLKELIGQVGEAMEAGDAEQALALLEKDAPQHQNAPPFHFVHGTLLYRLTRLDEAINAFQRSTEVGAPLPEYLSNLAVALIDRSEKGEGEAAQEDLSRAIEALESAITMGPKLPHTYVNLGSAYLNAGDKERARANLELALEIDADFEPAKRGHSYEGLFACASFCSVRSPNAKRLPILFLDSAPAPEQWEGPEAKYAHCDDRALWPTLDGFQVLTSIGAAVMANDASSGKSLPPLTTHLMWLQVWSTPQSRPTDMVSSMNARPSGNIKRCSENKAF